MIKQNNNVFVRIVSCKSEEFQYGFDSFDYLVVYVFSMVF